MGYRILLIGTSLRPDQGFPAGWEQPAYRLSRVGTAVEGVRRVVARAADIVLLDADLPDMPYLSALGVLRQTSEGRGLPILVVGARRSEAEMIAAFDGGADDFILAPACPPEALLARLRAALRRRSGPEESISLPIAVGPVALDCARRQCTVGAKPVALRPLEFLLLDILLRKAGRVLSRAYLLEAVWGMSSEANTRAVDACVSRLRRALGPEAAGWVETVEKFGYRFRETNP